MPKLSAESIQKKIRIEPAVWEKKRIQYNLKKDGDHPGDVLDLSYGLCEASYDIRLSSEHTSSVNRIARGCMRLAVSAEKMWIPNDVIAEVRNKSTLARLGLLQPTTTLEPGWYGHITLEIMYFGPLDYFQLLPGMPIAQVLFDWIDNPAKPYAGRYQDQPEKPVEAF